MGGASSRSHGFDRAGFEAGLGLSPFPGLHCLSYKGLFFKKTFYLFIHERDLEREAETQAEGEAGSMQGPDVGLDPGSLGSRPRPRGC